MILTIMFRRMVCRYTTENRGASDEAMDKLSSYIEEIKQWMSVNKLKLNESKTEFFLLQAPQGS